jgi:hypothetical protein
MMTEQKPASPYRRTARWWLAVCFLGNGGLELAQFARARPPWRAAWPLLVGAAPNFFAVGAIAGAVSALALASASDWTATRRVAASLGFTVVGLLTWEAAQPYTRRGVFDWWDIGATLLAAAVLFALHLRWGPR